MSEQSGGDGWWLASDGKWYPPQPGEPSPSRQPTTEKWWSRRVPVWALVIAAVAGIALGAASTSSANDKAATVVGTAGTTATSSPTTTTERATTTTHRATTTTAAPTTTVAPTTTPPAAETEITVFEGSGQSTTRPFTVPDGWEIQWDASDFIQIYVYDGGGELVGIAANQLGAGEGAAYQSGGGSYYLQMNAMGTWTVHVVDVN